MSSRKRNAGRSYGRARLGVDVLQIVTGTTRDSRWGSRLFAYRWRRVLPCTRTRTEAERTAPNRR